MMSCVGSCLDAKKNPESGVMLEMREFGKKPVISDTVVMNNRGYWQLRGKMGVLEISVSEDSPEKTLVDLEDTPVTKRHVIMGRGFDVDLFVEPFG